MPIFHDPHEKSLGHPSSDLSPDVQREVEDPTSYLDLSLSDSIPSGDSLDHGIRAEMDHQSSGYEQSQSAFDRMELIERLKRTKSPLRHQRQDDRRNLDPRTKTRPTSQESRDAPSLPFIELKLSRTSTPDPLRDLAAAGLEIERPRSALHSGDFREKKSDGDPSAIPYLATSPVVPWNRSFPAAALPAQQHTTSYRFDSVFGQESRAVSRARATSQSSTSIFAFLPPTSPLVQQDNSTDIDPPSRPVSRQGSRSPERSNRRHTFSPASFQTHHTATMARSISGTPAARHLRYGTSTPYQAHQPRRSVTINQPHTLSNPQTPYPGSRRPSFSSEASPLQHAPMVGSYEESILRGRMSTTPSRPLDFVAKIGVLGRGQCKSNLKCPPHVAVPFPAVFYSYNTGNGRISDNEPSPYVGLIDLENSLSAPKESNQNSKRKRQHTIPPPDPNDMGIRSLPDDESTRRSTNNDLRKMEKRKRRSTSPKAPPGGSYRIPVEGQLQIVLKNPNNTAVKLFLVPYDLSDMEPGQKTFIRQRSYSAGPIIDMPSSSRKNLGTDRPEAALSNSEDPNDRPILRYLIHLHICCPSKGRFYLYKSIRVVFANRVPDGKEKLQNEIQLPEPRYSAYKRTQDTVAPQHTSLTASHLTIDKVTRRRSTAWPLSRSQQAYDQIDGLSQRLPPPPPSVQFTGGPLISSAPSNYSFPIPEMQPIPFSLTRLAAIESRPASRDRMEVDRDSLYRTTIASPRAGFSNSVDQQGTFEKLSKGDIGYGGNAFSPLGSPTSPPNAGLLSQRLRGLEVQHDDETDL